ncbi:MAG TPA: hypothetical protein VGM30_19470 [Puia sp.]|jgi:hypothetical protein
MQSNIVSVTIPSVSSSLSSLPTAKIVRHPRSKKTQQMPILKQPDEDTLKRLNVLAKQYPFCILHRTNNFSWLL